MTELKHRLNTHLKMEGMQPEVYEDIKKAILKYRKEYIEKGLISIEAYDLIFGEY